MQPPNSHHLEAAEGWLELGNHVAAFETFCTQSPFGRNSIVVNYKN